MTRCEQCKEGDDELPEGGLYFCSKHCALLWATYAPIEDWNTIKLPGPKTTVGDYIKGFTNMGDNLGT